MSLCMKTGVDPKLTKEEKLDAIHKNLLEIIRIKQQIDKKNSEAEMLIKFKDMQVKNNVIKHK